MAFSLVRLNGKHVHFSSAGMPPVYLYRSKASTIEEILLKGMPLGAMRDFRYGLHELTLDEDDVLLLMTDGLPEQKNSEGSMFEYRRVQEALHSAAHEDPRTIIAELMKSGEAWRNGSPQEDDITLLVIKKKSGPAGDAS
jgi:sigma-B regulation protein RsbU (phosphoserine phosphatase)